MRRAAILMFHRVGAGREDANELSVTPEAFAAHLEAWARVAEPSELDDLRAPARRPRFAVTFDDGYADNYEVAAPIAARVGVPLTVYVTSGLVGTPDGFWWDRLGTVCRRADLGEKTPLLGVELEIGGRSLAVRLAGTGASRALSRALHARLRLRPPAEIDPLVDEVARQLGVDRSAHPGDRTLLREEVVGLARSPGVTVGAHTTTHARLSSLPAADQADTVIASKRDLELLTGRPVRHFAYPFGGRGDLDGASVAACRRAGFRTAATTVPGVVLRVTPRLRLPRFGVRPATDARELLARSGVAAGS